MKDGLIHSTATGPNAEEPKQSTPKVNSKYKVTELLYSTGEETSIFVHHKMPTPKKEKSSTGPLKPFHPEFCLPIYDHS